MSLLREIQNAAIDSESSLSTLLRKCKVLAARLGNADFQQWVNHELSGYQTTDTLPPYRVFRVNSKGHFSGPFGSGLKNADIPMLCIPDQFRERLSTVYAMQPVAELEALSSSLEIGAAEEPWNPNLVALFGGDIYQGMNCMQAWKVIPIPAIRAILDEVRNRILSFVLDIEAADPSAGDSPGLNATLPPRRVEQIFNTYFSGNVGNVATGSTNVTQNLWNNEASAEIFTRLIEALGTVPNQELVESVTRTVREMQAASDRPTLLSLYNSFMSVLADHIQVLGPVVAPYLPFLATLLR